MGFINQLVRSCNYNPIDDPWDDPSDLARVLPSLTTPGVGHWMATGWPHWTGWGVAWANIEDMWIWCWWRRRIWCLCPLEGQPGWGGRAPSMTPSSSWARNSWSLHIFRLFFLDQSFDGKMGFDKSFDMTSTKVWGRLPRATGPLFCLLGFTMCCQLLSRPMISWWLHKLMDLEQPHHLCENGWNHRTSAWNIGFGRAQTLQHFLKKKQPSTIIILEWNINQWVHSWNFSPFFPSLTLRGAPAAQLHEGGLQSRGLGPRD